MFKLLTYCFLVTLSATLISSSALRYHSYINEYYTNHVKNVSLDGKLELFCSPGYVLWPTDLTVPVSQCKNMGILGLLKTSLFGIGTTIHCDLRSNCSLNFKIDGCPGSWHQTIQVKYMCKKQDIIQSTIPLITFAYANSTGFINMKCNTEIIVRASLNWKELLDNCKSNKTLEPSLLSVPAKVIEKICDNQKSCAWNVSHLEEYCPNYYEHVHAEYDCLRADTSDTSDTTDTRGTTESDEDISIEEQTVKVELDPLYLVNPAFVPIPTPKPIPLIPNPISRRQGVPNKRTYVRNQNNKLDPSCYCAINVKFS